MKNFLKNNSATLLLYLLLVLTAIYYVVTYGKVPVHIYLNQWVGNALLDAFFFYITYLGDGLVMPFLILAILFYNVRTGIYTAFSFFSATIITSLLKYQFFDDVDRPSHVFAWTLFQPLRLVEGIDLHIHNSFPSGHATQVFAILMCIILINKSQIWKFLFLITAVLAAFSRVYLSQHWLIDITVGSIIGTLSSIFYYFVFIYHQRYQKLDKPLLKLNKSSATA